MYLYFLRESARFFLVITIVNFAVSILYLTGEPTNTTTGAMEILTIINVDGITWKVWVCYALSMLGVVPLYLFLISVYLTQYDSSI